MASRLTVAFHSAITLRSEEFSCYLESQGANEPPTLRKDDALPLLAFEQSVFSLVRAEASMVSRDENADLAYGSTVRIYCPTTRLYAVVLKTETGSKNKLGYKIVMRPWESSLGNTSIFRVLSKYKTRSDCDSVFHGDNVVLLLENSDLFVNAVEGGSGLEVVASLDPNAWNISRYDRGHPYNAKTIAHAGHVLAFHHRLHQTMMAHGEPKNPHEHKKVIRRHALWQVHEKSEEETLVNQLQVVSQSIQSTEKTSDVYFQATMVSESESALEDRFQCSCNCLWIIEHADPTVGGPLKVGDQYRVRHVSSAKYLTLKETVPGKFVVTTIEGTAFEETLFDLDSSAENSQGHISSYHSYVRLRHCGTGQWLGASPISDYAIVPAITYPRANTRDRVVLRHAPPKMEQQLFFLMSHIRFLRQYVMQMQKLQDFPMSVDRVVGDPEVKKLIERTLETLYALVLFCSRAATNESGTHDVASGLLKDSVPIAENQTMMTELGILDILIQVIAAPFHSRDREISVPLAGGVLSASDVNEKQCAAVNSVCRLCFRLFRQIVKGSKNNLNSVLKYLDIFLYMEQFHLRVADTLHALLENAGLLTIEEVASVAKKFLILNEAYGLPSYIHSLAQLCHSDAGPRLEAQLVIVELFNEYPEALFQTTIEIGRLIITPRQRSAKKEIEGSMALELFITHGDEEQVEYFAACANLLLALSDSTDNRCIQFVTEYITREHLLLILQCVCRDSKNSNLADSIKATYCELAVKLYLHRDLDLSMGPRVMVVGASGSRIATVSGDGSFVRQIKLLALELLKGNTTQVAELRGKNRLLCNCIGIWQLFLAAGMVSLSELQELVPVLLNILDGESDVLSTTTTDEKWCRYELNDDTIIIVNTKIQICSVLQAFLKHIAEDAVNSAAQEIAGSTPADVIYNNTRSSIAEQLTILDKKRTMSVLHDLILYQSPELVRSSVALLSAYCNIYSNVAQDVLQLHVLDTSHTESYKKLVALVARIQHCAKKGPNVSSEDLYKAISELAEMLRNILAAGSSMGMMEQSEDSLQKVPGSPMASVQPSSSSAEVDNLSSEAKDYLQLLRTWGVYNTIMEVLPSHTEEKLFYKCCELLTSLCEDPLTANAIGIHWPKFFEAMEKNPSLELVVLALLVYIWPPGNVSCPVGRQDIRVVIEIWRREAYVDALRALCGLVNEGAPRPQQQRDIATLLTESNVLPEGWWLKYKAATVLQLCNLLIYCGSGNSYVRCCVQKVLPSVIALRLLQSSTLSSLQLKTVILRFLAAVYLVDEDEDVQSTQTSRNSAWVQDETWWRILRDDFLVRFDEILSAHMINLELRSYTLEAALTLEAFFRTLFKIALVSKMDWILKELRALATSVGHIIVSFPKLADLSETEKYVFMLLGKTLHAALVTLNDTSIPKLKYALEKCQIKKQARNVSEHEEEGKLQKYLHSSPTGGGGGGGKEPHRETQLLYLVKEYFSKDCELTETELAEAVQLMRPQVLNNPNCPRRKILEKLLMCIGTQDFEASASVTMLKIFRYILESTPPRSLIQMQILFDTIGAVKVATVLLDAVDTRIIVCALQFGIAVLEGGNTVVQNNFLSYVTSNDEKFFVGVKRCLEKATLELQHYRKLVVGKKSDVSLSAQSTCFHYARYLLRFLQLLSEGHHFGLQEYVREQKDNLRSVNSVQIVFFFSRALLSGPWGDHESLVIQCFDLLTEFCQGPCPGNQAMLVTSDLGSLIQGVLLDKTSSFASRNAAVTTLLSIVEGTTDPHVAEAILRQVPLSTLESAFMVQQTNEDETELVFGVGIFLREMADLTAGTHYHYDISELLKKRPDIGNRTGRIQIMRGNNIELVYFRIPGSSASIREDSKQKLLWDVDRSSQSSKLASFYEMSDDLIIELDLVANLTRTINEAAEKYMGARGLRFVSRFLNLSSTYWIVTCVSLASFANILFLLDLLPPSNFLFKIIGILQLHITVIVFFIDWEIAACVFFHKYKKALLHKGQVDSSDYLAAKPKKISVAKEILLKASRTPTIVCVCMILISFLSIVVSSFFLAFHLFWIISLSPSLYNIVAAITQNKKTLALTLFLGMLVCYAFAIAGFAVFPEDFDTDNDESSHDNCSSLSHCFLYIITTGLRQGGGVGDVMALKNFGAKHFFSRRIYDFAFFGIMIIVFLNILFGIIIDTFAELRDAKHRKEEDMRLKCFICGIDSHIFDRIGDGFEMHVKHEHNMWQYLYFMHHLRLKDPNNFTGQESYIHKLLEAKDFSFFPSRCISLEGKLKDPAAAAAAAGSPSVSVGGDSSSVVTQALGMGGNLSAFQAAMFMRSNEMRDEFDDLKTTLRRMMQRSLYNAGGAQGNGNSRRGVSKAEQLNSASAPADVLDVACQTTFHESTVGLQFEVQSLKTSLSKQDEEVKKMKREMRIQVDEIWRLQQSNQISSELQLQQLQLRNEMKDLRRQLDNANAEKEILLRQNTFLQKEADQLVIQNTRMATDHRLHHQQMSVQESSAFGLQHSSLTSTLRRSLLERSKLFESLQFDNSELNETTTGTENETEGQNEATQLSSIASPSPSVHPPQQGPSTPGNSTPEQKER